jgi:uncharacterized protein (TIGR03437 family)
VRSDHLARFAAIALVFCCVEARAAVAPPLITPKGIVTSAAFGPPLLPGGAIAQGSVFCIFGSNLGPAVAVQVSAFPLQNALAGVSIQVIQGEISVAAIPLYVSAGQINALMPSTAPTGMVSIQVTFNGQKSNMSPVVVAINAPAIYTSTGAGLGPGSIQNFVSVAVQPTNSAKLTAKPGQVVTLWLTGLGPVANDTVAPTVGNLPFKVEVWVAGIPATVQYSGRTSCCAGIDQIDFTVPANAPNSCFAPVQVRVAGTAVSAAVTMAIDSQGNACADPNPTTTSYARGANIGTMVLIRRTFHVDASGNTAAEDVTVDQALGDFEKSSGADYAFDPSAALPPPGSCTVYSVTGDLSESGNVFISGGSTILDTGAVTVTGQTGTLPLMQFSSGATSIYATLFGSTGLLPANLQQSPLFLNPGNFTINGAGGKDVGAFKAAVAVNAGVTWTNEAQVTTVVRSQGLTVTWSGSSGTVGVGGMGVDLPTNSSTAFLCTALPGTNSFTVPGWVLANVPVTRANSGDSISAVALLSATTPVQITASGLNDSAAFFLLMTAKAVTFQ